MKELRPEEIMGNVDFKIEEVLGKVVSFGMTHVNELKQKKLKGTTVHIEASISNVLCKGDILLRVNIFIDPTLVLCTLIFLFFKRLRKRTV